MSSHLVAVVVVVAVVYLDISSKPDIAGTIPEASPTPPMAHPTTVSHR